MNLHFEKLSVEDLPFLCEVRNGYAEDFLHDKSTWLHGTDNGHLSDDGHKRFSELILNHINDTGILNGSAQ